MPIVTNFSRQVFGNSCGGSRCSSDGLPGCIVYNLSQSHKSHSHSMKSFIPLAFCRAYDFHLGIRPMLDNASDIKMWLLRWRTGFLYCFMNWFIKDLKPIYVFNESVSLKFDFNWGLIKLWILSLFLYQIVRENQAFLCIVSVDATLTYTAVSLVTSFSFESS